MRKRTPFSTLFFTIFIDLLGFGIVIPLLPVLAKRLSIESGIAMDPDVAVGVVAASFSIMQFIFSPVWGSLSDRIGRRPIILGSILATGLGYFLLGISDSLVLLLLARVISGIGSANISAAQAYIADITPPEERAKRMGMIGASFGLGFVFGPPIGGWLYAEGGLPAVGFFTAALCLLNFIMAWFTLPESISAKVKDKRKSFMSSFDGLRTIWKVEVVGELFLINFLYIAAFSMFQSNASLLWSEHFQVTEKQNGLIFGFIGICSAIVQGLLIGKFQQKIGLRKLLLLGIPMIAIALLLIPLPSLELFYYCTAFCIVLLAVGNGFITPTVNSLVSIKTAPQNQGKILGLMQSTGSLARAVGPLAAGYLYSKHFTTPYFFAVGLMCIAFYFAFQLMKQIKSETVQEVKLPQQDNI